jgi:phospholipid/cholesterol/gamma-HCH transport system substrate-binding protein
VDLTYKQEIGVGAVVLAGLALFVFGMFWLSGDTLESRQSVTVMFSNVSGLKQGDAVFVSGVRKGRVAGVELEGVGRVRVQLELAAEQTLLPRRDATVAVQSLNFFGDRFIDYNPGSAPEMLPEGRPIVGTKPADVQDLASSLAGKADEILGGVSGLVNEQLGVDLRNTLIAMQRTLNVLTEVGRGPLFNETARTLEQTGRVMARIDTMLGSGTGQRIDTLTANLSVLTNHLGHATASIDTLLHGINRGEGTLGRMAADTALYDNLNATLQAMTALLTDLRERPGRYLTVKVF